MMDLITYKIIEAPLYNNEYYINWKPDWDLNVRNSNWDINIEMSVWDIKI